MLQGTDQERHVLDHNKVVSTPTAEKFKHGLAEILFTRLPAALVDTAVSN